MERNPTTMFFDTAELVHLLCHHLTFSDRRTFSLVNKLLSSICVPVLCGYIPAEIARRLLQPYALGNKIHHFKTLDLSLCSSIELKQVSSTIRSFNLQRLYERKMIEEQGLEYTGLATIDAHAAAALREEFSFGLRGLTFLTERYSVSAAPIQVDNAFVYANCWNYEDDKLLVKLLKTTPRLTYLAVPGQMLFFGNEDCLDTFLETIMLALPSLRHLIVQVPEQTFVPQANALTFLSEYLEIPSLMELQCQFEIDDSTLHESLFLDCRTRIEHRSLDRTASRLKSLRLPNTNWPLSFLVPFFKNCVKGLETLSVPWLATKKEGNLTAADFCMSLRQSSPTLQYVTASARRQHHSGWDYESSFDAVIRSCAASGSGGGLRSFVLDGIMDDGDLEWLKVLAQLHSQTLEAVVVHDMWIEPDNWASLAWSCPNLRIFYNAPMQNSGLRQTLVTETKEWACTRTLKNLSLPLGDPPHHHPRRAKPAKVHKSKEQFRRFYESVSCLTELEDWTLSYSCAVRSNVSITDLMLDDQKGGGYLGQLAGLKKLRHITLWQDFWSRMGVPEIEFIAKNWVSLRRITFRTDNVSFWEEYLEEMHCWLELKRLRPEIEFAFIAPTEREDVESDYESLGED
ncbi:hypothetical protein BGZ83_011080 [Gryganskiella cystojenkinii]|nr:hypothetical protein BGZ83_011080 [Gryganskiella cystojenkinii]